MSSGLYISSNGHPIQSAVRRKGFQQVPIVLNDSQAVIRLRGLLVDGEIDMQGCLGVIIRPSTNDVNLHYDSDTTKTWTIGSGFDSQLVMDVTASTLTISGTDPSIEIGGF